MNFKYKPELSRLLLIKSFTPTSGSQSSLKIKNSREHSIRICIIRKIILILSGLVVCSIVYLVVWSVYSTISPSNNTSNQIIKQDPNFFIFDQSGNNLRLHAKVSVQDFSTLNLIRLNELSGVAVGPSDLRLGFSADLAVYNVLSSKIDLSGHVKVSRETNYALLMDEATVNLYDRTLSSKTGLFLQLDRAQSSADRGFLSLFELRSHLSGHVKTTWNGSLAIADDKSDEKVDLSKRKPIASSLSDMIIQSDALDYDGSSRKLSYLNNVIFKFGSSEIRAKQADVFILSNKISLEKVRQQLPVSHIDVVGPVIVSGDFGNISSDFATYIQERRTICFSRNVKFVASKRIRKMDWLKYSLVTNRYSYGFFRPGQLVIVC